MSIGIIGTGWGTRVQVPAFQSLGLEVVGLAARDRAKTERQAREHGIAFATDDWRRLLERDDVRVVSIVTPPHTHREIALAALAAGKHVLCEKPMALDTAESMEMLAAARAHPDQWALIDHELRFLPAIQEARSRIQRGDFGTLRHVEVQIIGSGRADPQRTWNWWSDAAQGGGVLGAAGSHQLDLLQFLIGPIAAVNGLTHTFIAERPAEDGPRPVTSDDYAVLMLRFADGGLGTVSLSVVAGTGEPNRVTAHFEHGALRFAQGRLLVAGREQGWVDHTPLDLVTIPEALRGNDFQHGTVYLGEALKQALQGDATALEQAATFADGHRVQRLMDAARQSHAAGGCWVGIDA
jgi:predicted dehydrogenase